MKETVIGLLIPLLGTSLGSAGVFFMKKKSASCAQRILTGFAAGVMVAASVWSLLIPAIEQASERERWLPALLGFWAGVCLLLLLERVTLPLTRKVRGAENRPAHPTAMLVLAVTLHNIPEGMAVGVVYAGLCRALPSVTAAGALALALGIAIQNFPEGAIISMPLHAGGMGRARAFLLGVLSGAVEPLFGAAAFFLAASVAPCMPYFLALAAGAMVYVVVEELLPATHADCRSELGVLMFSAGFTAMMVLDVALG